jgi:hypothetical protein
MIFDAIDVKQNHSQGSKGETYILLLTAVQNLDPYLTPGEATSLKALRDRKPKLPKGDLLSDLSSERGPI